MESLLERIEENRLDALYLFINETLRDRAEFDHFFQNLVNVLPHNWSIQRVEVGHEFLSMVPPDRQHELFQLICPLESLRTLIISDGYVPRKDNGSVHTDALLANLPRARNLINLDLQRLRLDDATQVDLLAQVFECMQESLEEIRITGICLSDDAPNLDEAIQACVEMSNLRSLAISCSQNPDPRRAAATAGGGNNRTAAGAVVADAAAATGAAVGGEAPGNASNSARPKAAAPPREIISQDVLLELCQRSTTLQDLALRAMNLDDTTCKTIAEALVTNSFLTSLDIRQNPSIGVVGYKAILGSLERNYDLWCSVMVDNDSFQAKFNALIELNQANRGNLVRSPTREKLIVFLEKLSSHQNHHELDPTALWYFLTIHDSILHPLVGFLKFKAQTEDREAVAAAAAAAAAALSVVMQDPADTDKNKRPASEQEEEDNFKRSKLVERS